MTAALGLGAVLFMWLLARDRRRVRADHAWAARPPSRPVIRPHRSVPPLAPVLDELDGGHRPATRRPAHARR